MKDQKTTHENSKKDLNEENYRKVELLAKEIAKKLVREMYGQNISGPLQLQLLGNEFAEDEMALHQVSCEIELSDNPTYGEVKYRHYPTMIGPFITDKLRKLYYTYKETAIIDKEKDIMIGVSSSPEIRSAINNLTSTGFSASTIKEALKRISENVRYKIYSSLDSLLVDIKNIKRMAPDMTTQEVIKDVHNIIRKQNGRKYDEVNLEERSVPVEEEIVYDMINRHPNSLEINREDIRGGLNGIYNAVNETEIDLLTRDAIQEDAEQFINDIANETHTTSNTRRLNLENENGAEINIEIAEMTNELPIDPNINHEEPDTPDPHPDEVEEITQVENIDRMFLRRS